MKKTIQSLVVVWMILLGMLAEPQIQKNPEPQLKTRSSEELGPSGIHPIPGMQCVTFDPKILTKEELRNGPKLFGTLHWLYGKHKSQNDDYVLKIIRYYGMNASCMIDDSFNPFHFTLVDGRAPTGKMAGEFCFPHHLSSLRLKYYGPGPIRPFDTGKKQRGYHIEWGDTGPNGELMHSLQDKEAALAAMEAIRVFAFSQECYYDRPNASFFYMKAE